MTQDELARMPEGGATWKRIKFGTQVHLNGKWLCDCGYDDKDARQIVGSVNATIIAQAHAEMNIPHPVQTRADYKFWLNYAKGNA